MRMKIAFAGFRHGHINALYQLAKASKACTIAGEWEQDATARTAAAKALGASFSYATLEELLADDTVDIVAIGDYYGNRGRIAIEALRAGKHILSDKPLCTSRKELDEIERLAAEKNRKVGLMLDLRFHPAVVTAREIILSGRLGQIHNIYFGGQHPLLYGTRPGWYFEEGKHGGVINDIAIHGVDLLTYLTGKKVEQIVAARTWNAYARSEPHFRDCGQFMLTLEGKTGVIADISYAAPNGCGFSLPYYWRFTIWGENGVMEFSANARSVSVTYSDSAKMTKVRLKKPQTDYLQDFLNEIQGKETKVLSTGQVLYATKTTLEIQAKADQAKTNEL